MTFLLKASRVFAFNFIFMSPSDNKTPDIPQTAIELDIDFEALSPEHRALIRVIDEQRDQGEVIFTGRHRLVGQEKPDALEKVLSNMGVKRGGRKPTKLDLSQVDPKEAQAYAKANGVSLAVAERMIAKGLDQ